MAYLLAWVKTSVAHHGMVVGTAILNPGLGKFLLLVYDLMREVNAALDKTF